MGFMSALASRHEVLCCSPRLTQEAEKHLKERGVVGVPAELRPPSAAWSLRLPIQVAANATWRVPLELVRRSDVLHLSTVRAVPMIEVRDRTRSHLDFVDALSRNTLHRAATSPFGAVWRNEAKRLRRFEQEVGATVASSSCTTEEDRQAIGLPSIRVIPFGVEVPEFVPAAAPAPTVLFPGNLGYFANVDAAVWLAKDIFPAVLDAVPDARLLIVGARPTREIRALARSGTVEIHADVPRMTPFYGQAWLVAAPLRYGTGLQTKVLEAFAHGRPVVTTTAVASRVPGVIAGQHLEVADDTRSFAATIIRLLRDDKWRDRLSAQGSSAARSLSWESCAQLLEAAYQR